MVDIPVNEAGDEDRLPWLEAVEEEDESGPSPLKLIAAVVIGLVAIGLVVGGLFWLGERGASNGDGQIIAAPEGDYKVPPPDPGGMDVEGEGDTAFAASEGADPRARLNADALPEAPVTQRPAAGAAPAPARQPAAPSAPPAASPAAGPSETIQLGAFSSQGAANNAWKGLAGRFSYLAPLAHSVSPVESGGRTLYRLRASGAQAADICRRLRLAGEDCSQVG